MKSEVDNSSLTKRRSNAEDEPRAERVGLDPLVEKNMCPYWKEDKFYRGWPPKLAGSIICCTADDHEKGEPGCGGLRQHCDKEPAACPKAVMQGPECFCKELREMAYSCHGDFDFCELSEVEQRKMIMAGRG